jgi:hypothetical protein
MIPQSRRTMFYLCTILLCTCSIAIQAADEPEWKAQVAAEPLKLGSGQQPQAAIDPSGNIFVVWGVRAKTDKVGQIYVTVSTDGGQTFAKPVQVAADVPALPLGMRRGPRIAATSKSVVIAAIMASNPGGKAGEIVTWRSADQGKTWKQHRQVNKVVDSAQEGLHALAAGPDDKFFCVWQDLRSGKMEGWGASSDDGGQTWKNDQLIYKSTEAGVCPCCYPTAVIDPKGNIAVMFRNDLSGNKDMYLSQSADGGKTFGAPVKLGAGSWKLQNCPMDGGGLTVSLDGKITTAWRRNRELFVCLPGEKEKQFATGEQVSLAQGPGGVYRVFQPTRGGAVAFGAPGAEDNTIAAKGLDPAIAGAADGNGPVIVVWENGGTVLGKVMLKRK